MTERQKQAMALRAEGYSLRDIGKRMGTSGQNVQLLLKAACEERVPHYRRWGKDAAYPNVVKWANDRQIGLTKLSRMVGVSYPNLRRFLVNGFDVRKSTVDKVLAATKMTYEEAFGVDDGRK